MSVRTNNDVEGWHRRLNAKSLRGQLNLYLLLQLLAAEADLVDVNITLLKESHVIRHQHQRASSRHTNARLSKIWNRLMAGERTVRQTLKAASHVIPLKA